MRFVILTTGRIRPSLIATAAVREERTPQPVMQSRSEALQYHRYPPAWPYQTGAYARVTVRLQHARPNANNS